MSNVRVRFAPSPTGRLHPGNARTALLNALYAKKHDGRFLLRIDDTDPSREEPGAVDAIRRDLKWLGIDPDLEARQAANLDRHGALAHELVARGEAYLDDDAIRLRLGTDEIVWDDLVHGEMRVALGHHHDPVLLRADGRPTYTLASVADDVDSAITHVIRGDDHLTNTATHLRLLGALGAHAPVFAHVPLVVDRSGAPLSKRSGTLALEALRAGGAEPEPLVAYLVGLGTGRTIDPHETAAATLDLATIGRAAPTFDGDELARVQARWLEGLSLEDANARLVARGLAALTAPLWSAIRGNLREETGGPLHRLATLASADRWRAIIEEEVDPAIDPADREDLARAATLLASCEEPEAWLAAVGAATGRRGKALRLPIRKALSARADGPPLGDLLALLGPDRATRRLLGHRA